MSDILDDLIAAVEAGTNLSIEGCRCGGCFVETEIQQIIPIGEEGETFTVMVPALKCDACGEVITDHRAEVARHAGACRHLGLLTPEEVREVRAALGMTRKQFAQSFAIPPASMERWENGRLMQNKSMDMLLRAIRMPGVALALDLQASDAAAKPFGENVIAFRALAEKSDEYMEGVRERQAKFKPQMYG